MKRLAWIRKWIQWSSGSGSGFDEYGSETLFSTQKILTDCDAESRSRIADEEKKKNSLKTHQKAY